MTNEEKNHMLQLSDQRAELANTAAALYTDAFPGSRAWLAMNDAEKKLRDFDVAHPEVIREIQRRRDAQHLPNDPFTL